MISVNDYSDTMVDCFDFVEKIEILNDGKVRVFKNDSKYFAKTVENLKNTFEQARLMPAFGVSIHDDTIEAIAHGEWIKVYFTRELEKNGLPFNSIVFKLDTVTGMNIIREYNNRYDGRCLYVDFDTEVDLNKALF